MTRKQEQYRNARKLGATAMGAWFDYNQLISRGLVEAWQDNSLAIVAYPIAIRRRLSFDCLTIANKLRQQRAKRFGGQA